MDFDDEFKKLVKANKLLKSEGESVQKLLMNGNPEDGLYGGPSLWKLHEISGELMRRIKS